MISFVMWAFQVSLVCQSGLSLKLSMLGHSYSLHFKLTIACPCPQVVSFETGRVEVHAMSQQFSALMPEEVDQFAQFLGQAT